MNFPLAVWDFTLSVNKSSEDHTMIIDELERIAKKWVFQKEKPYDYDENGERMYPEERETEDDSNDSDENDNTESSLSSIESDNDTLSLYSYDSDESINSFDSEREEKESENGGYIHWQGRISLMKKKRKSELLRLLYEHDMLLANAHWSPCSNYNMGNMLYVMKIDSKIDGPWTDKDEKPIPIPKQIKMIESLYPYQQEIIDRSKYMWNCRKINVLYDSEGCKGKTTLATYCAVNKIGKKLPCLNDYRDLMQCIMCMPIQKLYFIDMPRAINKNKLAEFYAGIEDIKNGFCFDTRYKYTELYFDAPEIWIFTNKLPEYHLLSIDRWIIWTISDNKLYLYNNGDLIQGPEIKYPEPEPEPEPEEKENEEEIEIESVSSDYTDDSDIEDLRENPQGCGSKIVC